MNETVGFFIDIFEHENEKFYPRDVYLEAYVVVVGYLLAIKSLKKCLIIYTKNCAFLGRK